VEFLDGSDYRSNMPLELHEFAEGAQRDLGAIKDRVVMLKPGDDIVTGPQGCRYCRTYTGSSFAGDGRWRRADHHRDAATNEIASFQHPKARFGYDAIPDLAIRNRRA